MTNPQFFIKKISRFAVVLLPVFFVLPGLPGSGLAQDKIPVNFGKVSAADFNPLKSDAIDSNTQAAIIADWGNTSFVGNSHGWVSYIFKRVTRIKILSRKGTDAATVKVYLYRDEDESEQIDNIEATSYNLENGAPVEVKLQKKDVYSEEISKNWTEKKFTLPAVKEGTIIEYSYSITSPFDFRIPEWKFQSTHYPCLWSEYNIAIPNLVIYTMVRQGVHPFYIDKAGEGQQSYRINEKVENSGYIDASKELVVNAITYKHRWVMKDVPAFYAENYINAPDDFTDKIQFQLAQIYNGESRKDVDNSWTRATESLLKDSRFGQTYQNDHFFETPELDQLTANAEGEQEKMRKIYFFVRDRFSCSSYSQIYAKTALEKVYAQKSGSVAEINLLLVNLLRKNGIHADPVLLSTREYGSNIPTYPILERLNYVVVGVYLGGALFCLDASQPLLSFGKLPEDCYNGHARVICMRDSASIYFNADNIKEGKISSVIMINDLQKQGVMTGTCQVSPGYFQSLDLRNQIKKEGRDEYFKAIQKSFGPDWKISNGGIDSLNQLEMPVSIHYDLGFDLGNDNDIFYFTPMLTERYTENIFKAAERKYPVEMPYPVDNTYVLNMEVPTGYVVEELPKSAKVSYNGNEGFFEYLVGKEDSTIQMRVRVKLNKATFGADEYNTLRDFFAYVVKKENEPLVFRKKK